MSLNMVRPIRKLVTSAIRPKSSGLRIRVRIRFDASRMIWPMPKLAMVHAPLPKAREAKLLPGGAAPVVSAPPLPSHQPSPSVGMLTTPGEGRPGILPMSHKATKAPTTKSTII